ncbi:hypothetical protein BHM03_00006521, partial [Ensete ventricosum]
VTLKKNKVRCPAPFFLDKIYRYSSYSRSMSRSRSPYRYSRTVSRSLSRSRSRSRYFVVDVHLVVDPWTRESRGFGFVTMSTLEEADSCIKYLNRSVLEGRVIIVEKVKYCHLIFYSFAECAMC